MTSVILSYHVHFVGASPAWTTRPRQFMPLPWEPLLFASQDARLMAYQALAPTLKVGSFLVW